MEKSETTQMKKYGTANEVFHKKARMTRGKRTIDDFMLNKNGKVVSKVKSAQAKTNPWIDAVCQARKENPDIKGFVAIKKGTVLYKAAHKIMAEAKKK